MIKRGLGALAVVTALSTTGVLMPASAHAAPAKALGWVKVKSYIPANAANLARCKKDGQYYADGSTGYQCKYFPDTYAPHQGKSHYELWVGP